MKTRRRRVRERKQYNFIRRCLLLLIASRPLVAGLIRTKGRRRGRKRMRWVVAFATSGEIALAFK